MATQTLEFNATSGLTITLKLFALESDVVVDSVSATEKTNDLGRYTAAFTDLAASTYRANGFVGAVGGFVNEIYVTTAATDTFLPEAEFAPTGEPGQGAPPVSATLREKVSWIYKAWRNQKTQTGALISLFADDAATVDQKATLADDGTTATIGEMESGP